MQERPTFSRPASIAERLCAALIAGFAWYGLAIHTMALLGSGHSIAATLWILLAYFTVTTNLLVAVVFTRLAIGQGSNFHPSLLSGVTLAIALVGVVYGLLLHGREDLTAGSPIANLLLHGLTPLSVQLFWLLFVRKGALQISDSLLWAIYPLLYLIYALIRGSLTAKYPYPFIDAAKIGLPQVLLNALLIGIAYLACGIGLVLIDNRLGARQKLAAGHLHSGAGRLG